MSAMTLETVGGAGDGVADYTWAHYEGTPSARVSCGANLLQFKHFSATIGPGLTAGVETNHSHSGGGHWRLLLE